MGFFEARFGRPFGWYLVFRLMLSPAAVLAPILSCAGAITFGSAFGRWGAVLGGGFGLLVGVACIVGWYALLMTHVDSDRERALADEIAEDLETGRIAPARLRPARALDPVEAIPLDLGAVSPVDLGTDIGTAIARIELHAHGDPNGAVVAAEILATKHGRDARVISVLARALHGAGRPAEAATRASEALHMAVLSGHMGPVAQLVSALGGAREGFVLEPSVARALAAHFDTLGDVETGDYFRGMDGA